MTKYLKYLPRFFSLTTGNELLISFTVSAYCIRKYTWYSGHYNEMYHIISHLSVIFGAICFAILGEIFGRKLSILFTGIPYIIGLLNMLLFSTFQRSAESFFTHIMFWTAQGGVLAVLPIYLGEITEKSTRGKYVAFVAVALRIAYCTISIPGPQTFYGYLPHILMLIFCLLLLVRWFVYGLETPYFYVRKDKKNCAKITLEKMRTTSIEKIDEELEEVEGKCHVERIQKRFLKIFRNNNDIKAVISMIGLILLSTQIRCFVKNMPIVILLQEIGVDWQHDDKFAFANKLVDVLMVIGAILCAFLVDKLGRKKCLNISCYGALGSVLIIGIHWTYTMYFIGNQTSIVFTSFLSGLGGLLFPLFYDFGLGTVPLILLGEMFPLKYNVFYAVLIISTEKILLLANNLFLYYSVDGYGLMFSVWSTYLCILCAIPYIKFCVMETNGLSLPEIQNIMKNRRSELVNGTVNLNIVGNNEETL